MKEVNEKMIFPLGVVSVCVSGGSGTFIETVPVHVLRLPPGMAVDGVKLVRVNVGRVDRRSSLRLQVTADLKCDPESGEHLESVRCVGRGGILQVAVRDNEWLASMGIMAEAVVYEPHGFHQLVYEAGAGASLYISAAWRMGESAPLAETHQLGSQPI